MMYCEQCDRSFPQNRVFGFSADQLFCESCRGILTEMDLTEDRAPCPNCRKLVAIDAKTCQHCSCNLEPSIEALEAEIKRENAQRSPHYIPESNPASKIVVFGVLGLILGGLLGFLLRPSVPLIGQLPFEHVITRGSNLRGMDIVLVSFAETSFNYLLVAGIIGCVIGAGMGYLLFKRKNTLYASNTLHTDKKSAEPREARTGNDIAEHIRQLANLKDNGILTDEEFQAKKTELLNRL